MNREYMTADQRFAATRPDVLTYQTEVLANDVTLAGNIWANLKGDQRNRCRFCSKSN